jgi:uncharacterized phage-like protein YoqJ
MANESGVSKEDRKELKKKYDKIQPKVTKFFKEVSSGDNTDNLEFIEEYIEQAPKRGGFDIAMTVDDFSVEKPKKKKKYNQFDE